MVNGIHKEAQEDDVLDKFSDAGEVKNINLNLDRRTGFVKGYALIEYASKKEADAAIAELDGSELLGEKLSVSYAFLKEDKKERGGGGAGGRGHGHGHHGRRH